MSQFGINGKKNEELEEINSGKQNGCYDIVVVVVVLLENTIQKFNHCTDSWNIT